MRLENKVVLLTGAANGMGEAHARRLSREGARLLLLDIDAERGAALAAELGDNCHFCALDVSSEAQWDTVIAEAESIFGGIDVLVNNAGIHTVGSFEQESAESLQRVLQVNVVGCWLGIQKVAPLMRRGGGGSIINLASLAGLRGMPNYSVYGSSKWAVRGLTRHAAVELGPDNIRVNAILPGAIDGTGMFDSSAVEAAELLDPLLEGTPLRRFGAREDVSALIVYLASDESRFTTGADHVIDGGKGA